MLRSQSVGSFDTDEDFANVEDNMYETLVSRKRMGWGWSGVECVTGYRCEQSGCVHG